MQDTEKKDDATETMEEILLRLRNMEENSMAARGPGGTAEPMNKQTVDSIAEAVTRRVIDKFMAAGTTDERAGPWRRLRSMLCPPVRLGMVTQDPPVIP